MLNILDSKQDKNYVTIYDKRKRCMIELPRNYMPFEKSFLYN